MPRDDEEYRTYKGERLFNLAVALALLVMAGLVIAAFALLLHS